MNLTCSQQGHHSETILQKQSPWYFRDDLPIKCKFVRPHDKSLTDSFLDKLMPILQMLTKLEDTIPHLRRVEKCLKYVTLSQN